MLTCSDSARLFGRTRDDQNWWTVYPMQSFTWPKPPEPELFLSRSQDDVSRKHISDHHDLALWPWRLHQALFIWLHVLSYLGFKGFSKGQFQKDAWCYIFLVWAVQWLYVQPRGWNNRRGLYVKQTHLNQISASRDPNNLKQKGLYSKYCIWTVKLCYHR